MKVELYCPALEKSDILCIGEVIDGRFSSYVTKQSTLEPRKLCRAAIVNLISKCSHQHHLDFKMYIDNHNDTSNTQSVNDCVRILAQLNYKATKGGFVYPNGNNGMVDNLCKFVTHKFTRSTIMCAQMTDFVYSIKLKMQRFRFDSYDDCKKFLREETIISTS